MAQQHKIFYLVRSHSINFLDFRDEPWRPVSLDGAIEKAMELSKEEDVGSCSIHETTNTQIKTFMDGKEVPLGSDC